MSDAVQPVADHVGGADGRRPPDQDKEGGLEGVLGVGAVAQDAAADAQHHGAVAQQQRLEGGLVTVRGEAFEQLAVGQAGQFPAQYCPAEPAKDGIHWTDWHVLPSLVTPPCVLYISIARPAAAGFLFSSGPGRVWL